MPGLNRGDVQDSTRPGHEGCEPAQEEEGQTAVTPSSSALRAPDGQSGTRNAALAINTSYQSTICQPRETPLGKRHVVYGLTATNARRELAMFRTQKRADAFRRQVERAIRALHEAAYEIVQDREGTKQ